MTPAELSYSDVFQKGQPRTPWCKLGADEPLSILRSNFWGKDIRDEKRKWQETQTADHQMDTDEAPVKFAFDIGIAAINISTIWVREDYVLLYDYCTARFARPSVQAKNAKPPSVVITGQPGIGKTYWTLYAICRRLGEKKALIWYYEKKWYLFVEDGVFLCPRGFSAEVFKRVGIWVLVNCDSETEDIPAALASWDSKLHTIITSSPQEARWKPLLKTTWCSQLIMDPWSWDEIFEVAIVHEFTRDEINKAQCAFDDLGPTPRFCIDYVRTPGQLAAYQLHYETELSHLSMKELKTVAREWSALNIKRDVSHAIFLIRREEVSPQHPEYLQLYTIEPITPHTLQTFAYLLKEAEQEQRLDIYESFAQVPYMRPLAGLAYEMIGHRRFQSEVKLTLIPMAVEQNPRRKNTVWQSQIPHAHELVGTIAFNFTPRTQWPGPDVVNPFTYYMPESSNQVAFDSFVVVDRVLYMFKFMIAPKHAIRAGIMDFLSQQSLRTTWEELRFVFIIPPECKVECAQASDNKLEGFWNNVKLYSAVFNPKKEE